MAKQQQLVQNNERTYNFIKMSEEVYQIDRACTMCVLGSTRPILRDAARSNQRLTHLQKSLYPYLRTKEWYREYRTAVGSRDATLLNVFGARQRMP